MITVLQEVPEDSKILLEENSTNGYLWNMNLYMPDGTSVLFKGVEVGEDSEMVSRLVEENHLFKSAREIEWEGVEQEERQNSKSRVMLTLTLIIASFVSAGTLYFTHILGSTGAFLAAFLVGAVGAGLSENYGHLIDHALPRLKLDGRLAGELNAYKGIGFLHGLGGYMTFLMMVLSISLFIFSYTPEPVIPILAAAITFFVSMFVVSAVFICRLFKDISKIYNLDMGRIEKGVLSSSTHIDTKLRATWIIVKNKTEYSFQPQESHKEILPAVAVEVEGESSTSYFFSTSELKTSTYFRLFLEAEDYILNLKSIKRSELERAAAKQARTERLKTINDVALQVV